MKKIIYSLYAKLAAVLLFVLCAVLCMNTVINGWAEYSNEEMKVYDFERSFNGSRYFSELLSDPIYSVYSAYKGMQPENTEYQTPYELIRLSLSHLENSDKLDYFVSVNDMIFTNCGAGKKEDILNGNKFWVLEERYGNGSENYEVSPGGRLSNYLSDIPQTVRDSITVCAGINNEYAEYYEELWNDQEEQARSVFIRSLVLALLALLILVYLIAVCGKRANGEYTLMWIDLLWSEVHLISLAAAFFCAVGVIGIGDTSTRGYFPMYMGRALLITLTAIGALLGLTSILSIARKAKCKKLAEGSVVCRIVKRIWKIFVRVCKYIPKMAGEFFAVMSGAMSKKTGVLLIAMLFVYTALIGIFGIITPDTPFGLILAILLFCLAGFVIAHRSKDTDEIKRGVSEIRGGDLGYKIPELKSEDLKKLADDVNEIAAGLDESVSAKLRAERLKTDLITNVSHDLKTPITSIISYTELLSKVEGLPQEAEDYVRIIAKKGERLKNLTQDLFDISRVQSGNESINLEKLDMSLLINQSLGEHDSEIKRSELNFCVDTERELYISADGRKMSRVMSNLISNILKYTMKNTRVFISAFEEGSEVVTELKNISSYPIEFDAKEIVGRFVRGDESRTEEGNGLGLAIAKSYTEACGGSFKVVLDGDMFKTIIRFRKFE